jgi:hypothetical protein
MKPISMHDIAHALAHCDPGQLAVALAQAGAESITRAAVAFEAATDLVATFPRDEVIAEADALLYDVLRWPVADTVPGWERLVTPESFAARQGVEIDQARVSLERLRSTEADAARELLNAGPIATHTLEQFQVTDCIQHLMERGVTPTRDNVRRTALDAAKAAMRRGDGDTPLVYSIDQNLAPRIMSPSPKVHAVLWLHRMDASPPKAGLLDERLDYLQRAAQALGASASAHARVVALRSRPAQECESPTLTETMHHSPAFGMVS